MAEDIVVRLKKLIKRIEGTYKLLESEEVTRGQLRVIVPIIKDGKGYSMAELAEMTSTDKGLVSRTIADLERNGIVQRDKSDNIGKNFKIILTPKGQAYFDDKISKYRQAAPFWVNRVTAQEIETFKDILEKVTSD